MLPPLPPRLAKTLSALHKDVRNPWWWLRTVAVGGVIRLVSERIVDWANARVDDTVPILGALLPQLAELPWWSWVFVALALYVAVLVGHAYWEAGRQHPREGVASEDAERKSNEALFDVRSPSSGAHTTIHRGPDGTLTVDAASFSPIVLIHRGTLTTVERIVATPIVRWHRADGIEGWETRAAATRIIPWPESRPLDPANRADMRWVVNGRWELHGPPLTMAQDEELSLPATILMVIDHDEVGARFARGERCEVVFSFLIRTSQGSFTHDHSFDLTATTEK